MCFMLLFVIFNGFLGVGGPVPTSSYLWNHVTLTEGGTIGWIGISHDKNF